MLFISQCKFSPQYCPSYKLNKISDTEWESRNPIILRTEYEYKQISRRAGFISICSRTNIMFNCVQLRNIAETSLNIKHCCFLICYVYVLYFSRRLSLYIYLFIASLNYCCLKDLSFACVAFQENCQSTKETQFIILFTLRTAQFS